MDGTSTPGAKRYKVVAGRNSAINVGELVFKGLAKTVGTAWTAGGAASALKPSVGTDYIAGLAASTSTETTTAAGTVDVIPNLDGMTYLVAPNSAAAWDTQSEYDALVGSRIKLDYSSTGVITALATDSLYNGVVVEPLDIFAHPGKVRFLLRQALNYNA